MNRFHFHSNPNLQIRRICETPFLEGTTTAHQTGDTMWVSPRLNTALREAKASGQEMLNALLGTVVISCWPAIRPRSRLVTHGPLPGLHATRNSRSAV